MLQEENGFTLIEMLIVLTIITVLIILMVPNLTKKSENIHTTGCEALVQTVQAQVSAFQLEKGRSPNNLKELKTGYISEDQLTCKNGSKLTYDTETSTVGHE